MLRPAMPREVRRRAGHHRAQRSAQRQRDHVACQPLAEADAGIDAIGDQVGERIVGDQVERDVGIGAQEVRQHRREQLVEQAVRRGDAQGTGRVVAVLAQRFHRAVDLGQRGADAFEELPARLGQAHLARAPLQQARAHALFQLAHRLAQRRRRHLQLGCGAGEAAVPGDGVEGAQRRAVVIDH